MMFVFSMATSMLTEEPIPVYDRITLSETLNRDILKRDRTTAKMRHTKCVSKIEKHISDKGYRSELKVHRSNLAEMLDECAEAHHRYVASQGFERTDKEQADAWLYEVESLTQTCYREIKASIAAGTSGPTSVNRGSPSVSSATSKSPSVRS